jgi:iron complex outermembrane receptor protein
MKTICSILTLAFLMHVSMAQQPASLAGRVVDAETKRPLMGANVLVNELRTGTSTASDGSFRFPSLDAGEYQLTVSYVGYVTRRVAVTLSSGEPRSIDVMLTPTVLPGQTIVITATRARERETPVTFSTVTASDLAQRYSTQDIPQLLSELPSTTFYSESGNGIGYNYLSIRGFDQRRISVMINGIPQNDPEDHNVYWLDFPDLAANLQDIQVQRGGGNAFYGPPAIGGSVNLVTTTFANKFGIDLSAGYGSFNTRKYSASVSSGLVDNRYSFYGRLSRLRSDGYRDQSWADFSSYFLGAVRYDETMTTQLNFYGGPIADHLAYYGIPKAEAYSSDPTRRKQNPISRPEEIENFSQPHYELLHEWRLSHAVTLNNALFVVTGEGFFDYDGSWAPYSYYRITPENGFDVQGNPDDLYIPNALIRAFVGNRQYGWLPRVHWKHDGGELTLGAEGRIHRSIHWGALRWGENLPAGVTPDYHYYEYRGAKDILSLYAHELYRLRPDLTLLLDLQYAYNRYRLYDERYVGTEFSVPYHFLNPRVGLNYNVTERIHVYTQFSRTSREPRLKNLYDAAEASTPASWGPVTPQFQQGAGGRYDFGNPLVKPETLFNIEFGAGYTSDRLRAAVNFYHMDFKDEIIKKGQLDRFGQPVTGNAEATLHQGIEVTAAVNPFEGLELSGNMTASKNRLQRYRVIEGGELLTLDGNTIAGFPDFLANARLTFQRDGFSAALLMQHVGEFYTDNFQNPRAGRADPNRTVDAYTVFHAWLGYRWDVQPAANEVEVRLQVNNLFDRIYATHGEGGSFFPAADRNVFASLRLNL